MRRIRVVTSRRAERILAYLGGNVLTGIDSLPAAREFVKKLEELTPGERLYLDCALADKKHLVEFLAFRLAG